MGFEGYYSPTMCQAFNILIERFDMWYEERKNRTHLEEVPKRGDNEPIMHPVPDFISLAEILGYSKPQDRPDGTGPSTPETQALSAYEAALLERLETDTLTDEERERLFGPI